MFRNLLEAGNVKELVNMWSSIFPNMPGPTSIDKAEIVMHVARTAANSVSLKHRAYSHKWLLERDLPSELPDELKPSAERIYPISIPCVGISVNTRNEYIRPGLDEVRKAMEYSVEEAYYDGKTEPVFVRARMEEAKKRAFKVLYGIK